MAEKYQFNQVIITKKQMLEHLKSLGIVRGMVLLLQCDLNKLGYIAGGAQMVIDCLMELIGYDGTLVVATFTPYMCDPSNREIKINRNLWKEVRDSMSAFHKKTSLPKDEFARQFMVNEGVVRSYHPLYSFAAWGKYAKTICDMHPLHFGLNEDSPLGKISELNGYCVMLGEVFENSLMFTHVKYRKKNLPIKIISAPIESNRVVMWKSMLDYEQEEHDFSRVKKIMDEKQIVKSTYIGDVECLLFNAKEVDRLAFAYYNK